MNTQSRNNKTGKLFTCCVISFCASSGVMSMSWILAADTSGAIWNETIFEWRHWVVIGEKRNFLGVFRIQLFFRCFFLYLIPKLEYFVKRIRDSTKVSTEQDYWVHFGNQMAGISKKAGVCKMLIPKVHLPSYSFCINYKSCSRHLVLLVRIFNKFHSGDSFCHA